MAIYKYILAGIALAIWMNVSLAKDYILTAPPRETSEAGDKQYGAIARYLSKKTGKRIVYKHQTNWLSYMRGMKTGQYDIVFDGPHFNVWRIRHLNHVPLARIDFTCTDGKCRTFKPKWLIVYRKDTNRSRLSGRIFCLHAQPNFGTLSLLYSKFPNPLRQPAIKEMQGWVRMVKAVKNKTNGCEFTVSRGKHIKKVDPEGIHLQYEVYDRFVHQGFTARADLPADLLAVLKKVIISTEFRQQTKAFHKRFVPKGKALRPYRDSKEYDKPLAILSNGYLIPMGL